MFNAQRAISMFKEEKDLRLSATPIKDVGKYNFFM
jgi:hypothetical protein